jgi:proline iminopeptidase
MTASTTRRPLYPPIEPFARGRLPVGDGHEIYFEQCGNPKGKPAVVLHGGPGGGSSPTLRRFHNPKLYNIILFDQRGCGNSTPHAGLDNNTTWHLVADMELLRQHLKLVQWQVFGGSWGSTLALAYAQSHVERVSELVLRGIFLGRDWEIKWLYQQGASHIFPDAFARFTAPIPQAEHHDLIAAYHKRLHDPDLAVRLAHAKAWSQWEGAVISLLPDSARVDHFGTDAFATAFAAIESHYFVNRCFLANDAALLDGVAKTRHVHGRYDICTPVQNAFDLAAQWPEASLHIIDDAGHTAVEPGITDALLRTTDAYANPGHVHT